MGTMLAGCRESWVHRGCCRSSLSRKGWGNSPPPPAAVSHLTPLPAGKGGAVAASGSHLPGQSRAGEAEAWVVWVGQMECNRYTSLFSAQWGQLYLLTDLKEKQ